MYAYFVGPSSVVGSELGLAPPFPPMRLLEVNWSRVLSLVCEVALTVCAMIGENQQLLTDEPVEFEK
jgi:hypothetical protein